jgi:hypothetical protein
MNLFSEQDSVALFAMLIMGLLFIPPIAIGVIIAARHNAKRARVERRPEPLPPQAVLALARYHEEQLYKEEFKASQEALENALDQLAAGVPPVPPMPSTPSPTRLLLSHFKVQQFLRQKRNRN